MKHLSRSVLPGYGIAGMSTALATLAQFPLRPLVGSQHPYSFYYVAVMITAWYAGLRRALLAVTLGALSANYFFLPPQNSLAITGAANQIGLVLYLLVALVGALLIDALRQQQRPAEGLVYSWVVSRIQERDVRTAVEETEQRLIQAQQEGRTLVEELRMARQQLALANERVQRQQAEIERLASLLLSGPEGEESSGAEAAVQRLPIPGTDSLLLLRVAEIDYVEGRNGRTLVWARGAEHPTRYTMAGLEALLPAELFFRVHELYLVNLDRIRDLVFPGNDRTEIRLQDGRLLPLSRSRSLELRRRLGLEDDLRAS